jgi:hypothetical protein
MRNQKKLADLKIDDLVKFSLHRIEAKTIEGFDPEPKIETVYDSYSRAANDMHGLIKFTPWLILHSMSYGHGRAIATYEELTTFDDSKASPEQKENIILRMKKIERNEAPVSKGVLNKYVANITKGVLASADASLVDGLASIMPSAIILAWTAFEVMCEDLLGAATDSRPAWLSGIKGRGRARKLPAWESMTLRGKIHGESPDTKPGKANLSFRNVRAIRDSYYLVFHKDSREIDRAMRPRCIDTLHAARNIFVHQGGNIDEIFLNRVIGLSAFAHAKENHPLQLNFVMVRNMIEPVLVCGIKLIVAVNKWIIEHPDGKAP